MQAEADGLYNYLQNLEKALGVVLAKYAPDPDSPAYSETGWPCKFFMLCFPFLSQVAHVYNIESRFNSIKTEWNRVELLSSDNDVRFVLEVFYTFLSFVWFPGCFDDYSSLLVVGQYQH